MGDPGLFPADPYTAATAPGEPVSADRRRTLRIAASIGHGVHPLALARPGVRLHPDADPGHTASPENTADRPLRCGTCRWREQLNAGGARDYPKCAWRPATDQPDDRGRHRGMPPRYSASASTDVRAWWPACTDWQPGEVE